MHRGCDDLALRLFERSPLAIPYCLRNDGSKVDSRGCSSVDSSIIRLNRYTGVHKNGTVPKFQRQRAHWTYELRQYMLSELMHAGVFTHARIECLSE